MCSGLTSREEGLPIIRGRTFPTAFTPPASIKATTTEDIRITVTILPTITNLPTTDGPLTRGQLRSRTAGVGAERHGLASLATISSPLRVFLPGITGVTIFLCVVYHNPHPT